MEMLEMLPSLESLLQLFWLAAITLPCSCKALAGGQLDQLFTWGKTLEGERRESRFLVPHSYFTLFYLTGLIFNTLVCVDLLLLGHSTLLAPLLPSSPPLLPALLLQFQLTRRLLESALITRHGAGKMHLLHLIFALAYYPSLSLSTVVAPRSPPRWITLSGVWLFLWASLHQHSCHRILAALRNPTTSLTTTTSPTTSTTTTTSTPTSTTSTTSTTTSPTSTSSSDHSERYGLPRGDWFELVSSPHYLAEFLLYVGIFVSSGGNYLLGMNCAYQLLNFALVCTPPTHAWYLKNFPEYPRERRIFIPYLY